MDGTPFGRYRLVELLGRGGGGEVWLAHDTAADNRPVAIKLLPQHLAQDETYVKRFRGEAEKAAKLNNPHIIPIHNYGEIDGRLYVDMRLVEGRDLHRVLAGGPLEPARAVRIIEQVARALQAAHKVGLVHRDVKPSNILLDEDDFAYLIDFGIARGTEDTRMTGTRAMIGTPHYIAPERFRAREADARADIYALACVLYECLTGHPPFPGDTFESQIAGHLTDPPPRPSTTQPNVPAQFDAVIAKGMAKNPDERYATTVELADAARDATTDPIPRPTAGAVPDDKPPQPPSSTVTSVPTQHPPEQLAAYARELGSAATEHADWTNQPPTQLAPTGPALPPKPARPTHPRVRRLSRTKLVLAAVALVVTVAAVAVLIVVERRSHSHRAIASSTSTTTSTTTPTTTPTVDPVSRLLTLVPADAQCSDSGHGQTGSLAEVTCGDIANNGNESYQVPPWGLGQLWYALFPDQATLDRDFNNNIDFRPDSSTQLMPCPGMEISPQYWHRAATPQQSEGKIACFADTRDPSRGGVVWTVDSELLVGHGQALGGESTLAQVFQWWAAHYQ